MIYIFDDKKNRQSDYGWSETRFARYADSLKPIYQFDEIKYESNRKEIFSEGNVVLFHESFFDAEFNKHQKESVEIRRTLESFAQKMSNYYLAFFSGSKNGRLIDKNVAYLPVSVLYQNLEVFVRKTKGGPIDLRYLLYGEKPNIEQELIEKLEEANNNLELTENIKANSETSILFVRTSSNYLPSIIDGADYKVLVNDVSDEYLHSKTIEWLSTKKYDKIFIPLCFGPSLADFNGLRLATHIRCTVTKSQCSPIYIYGFVGMQHLITHECFAILQTKNIKLIDYQIEQFQNAIRENIDPLESFDLRKEIVKLKLDIPKNYEDSHSIANEWAIYRWTKAIGIDEEGVQKTIAKIRAQLYFKFLGTIYPIDEMLTVPKVDLEIEVSGQPKILYVDDDAEKGWYEILCSVLSDINGITFIDYLGDDLKKVSQIEIIEKTLQRIREDDIDLVILDFRLHPDDFSAATIKNVTGFKLLQNIKKINSGIQIVIFSATNKVWNLQALQEAGADGFIVKESPENSLDSSFTSKTLLEFIKTIDKSIKRGFLKSIFDDLKTIENQLNVIDDVPENKAFNNFLKKLKKQLLVIYTAVEHISLSRPITLDVVFLCCYTFLDLFKKYYLSQGSDHRYYLGFRKEELIRYNVTGNDVTKVGPFIPNEHYDKPGIFHVYSGLLKDYYHNDGAFDLSIFIKDFHKIRNYRNDYIHGSMQHLGKEDVMLIVKSLLPITRSICE